MTVNDGYGRLRPLEALERLGTGRGGDGMVTVTEQKRWIRCMNLSFSLKSLIYNKNRVKIKHKG